MNNSPLYIRLSLVSQAMNDKSLFEAVSLALAVKLTFRSSCVHNASIRRLKTLFKCGYGRLRNAINRGLEEGLLVFEGNNLVAKPLKVEGKDIYLRYKRPGGTYSNGHDITIREVSRELRKLFMMHLVLMKQNTSDTLRKANGEKPCSLRELRSKRRSSEGMRCKGFLKMEGMSQDYMAGKLNVCTKTVHKYTKELVTARRLSVFPRILRTFMPLNELNGERCLNVKKFYSGFFFEHRGIVCKRLTNSYKTYDLISGVCSFSA